MTEDIFDGLDRSATKFLAESDAKKVKFSSRDPQLWQELLPRANPQTLTVCKHLESEEADMACKCGYPGSVWADGDRVLFTMGDQWGHPDFQTQRIERPMEIATAQLLACLYNNADWLIELASKALAEQTVEDKP